MDFRFLDFPLSEEDRNVTDDELRLLAVIRNMSKACDLPRTSDTVTAVAAIINLFMSSPDMQNVLQEVTSLVRINRITR